jgi:hypothetical protein
LADSLPNHFNVKYNAIGTIPAAVSIPPPTSAEQRTGISIYEPCAPAQQPPIKALAPTPANLPAHSPGKEQDRHDRRRDPERAVQVRVGVEHVEEGRARPQRGAAPAQHLGRVHVEVLRVEGQREGGALAAAGAAVGADAADARGDAAGGAAGRGALDGAAGAALGGRVEVWTEG